MSPLERPSCPLDIAELLEKAQSALIFNERTSGEKALNANLRRLLTSVFHDRCCFCEVPLFGNGEIERFRPRTRYPHFAYEWHNLYLICAVCNRLKADRFPLEDGALPAECGYEDTVSLESPLLLDPCRDEPDVHLAFDSNGQLVGRTERGRATIDILRLNRNALLEARHREARRYGEDPFRNDPGIDRDFPALWRQFRNANSDEHHQTLPGYLEVLDQRRYEEAHERYSTETGDGLENYRWKASYIEKITIRNVGPIPGIILDLAKSESSQAPCFALLGNNGVGKSTLLKAIALALSGKNYVNRLRVSSKHLLAPKAQEGEVRIKTASSDTEIVMTLRRGNKIEFNSESTRSLLVAYGATRLLPRGRHKPRDGLRHAKIDNLFDPFLPLSNATKWLEGAQESQIAEMNRVLSVLLPSASKAHLVRGKAAKGFLLALQGEEARPLHELSDGYQSMIAMSVDVMEVMFKAGFEKMESAQGIVLIDEMGNHFHPSWRMRALTGLREAFPYIQFIYSTHDPLCLRGLRAGEVAVLHRNEMGHVFAMDDLPAVDRLRVDQLLRSEHFGLQSTVDPMLQDDIDRYEILSQLPLRNDEEEEELKRLVEQLSDARYLGSSRRERMLLQLLELEPAVTTTAVGGVVSAERFSQSTLTTLEQVLTAVRPMDRRSS